MDVAAAQTRLDMADRDAAIIGRESAHHRRRRIALNDHPIGPFPIEDTAQFEQQARGQAVERLPRLHKIESMSGEMPLIVSS